MIVFDQLKKNDPHLRLIGRRPFVDRDPVKRRIRELAGEGGLDDQVLLINGGADSGGGH